MGATEITEKRRGGFASASVIFVISVALVLIRE
jgi:hypothetical protein